MTNGPKIIGMWRDGEGNPMEHVDIDPAESGDGTEDTLELKEENIDLSSETEGAGTSEAEAEWTHYSDEDISLSSPRQYVAPGLLCAAIASWTGFFLWANSDIFATLPSPKTGIELISDWCLPIIVLALAYLLYMRNSSREAKRFTDVSSSLRVESERLQARLKTVNNELSIAREFLAGETRELETLGSQSSEKLNSAAGNIKSALSDGLNKMTALDEVGAAAYKNLQQLREHLPVVINTAKDVTNQIGNSGRAAQSEMAAMVTTLKNVGKVGTAAKQSLDELNERSEESLVNLSNTAEEIKIRFAKQMDDAENGSNRIASILKNSSTDVIDALHKARTELATETSESTLAIRTDLEALEGSLASLRTSADEEDERLKALVSTLNQNIVEISENVAELDNESGEKTAKLAFAMTALEQNSAALQTSLKGGYGVADGMIERMENLLVALDSGARELDETLPAAFDRMNKNSKDSIFLFGKMSEDAAKIAHQADAIASKVEKGEAAIVQQNAKMETLRDTGSETADAVLSRIQALSAALGEVREQNESLVESSGEKLISALLRVKDTAKQASEYSREVLENSIAGSAENFEKTSEEALTRIIDEKIASIAPKLETAVSSAVATTQSTAGHLTEQLTAIEEMTTSLEQRILFAKEKAEQSSDENFTRRVALLTESLNSTAIDVTKILSNEVTDTQWAAYLKGDRGIFARRAVRLLDAGEVREILLEYEGNSEFREHVNRYIHDFEGMLRGVLATRDGSAISVTLLSSDIGKLYVALAQAIERLRN